MVPRTEVEALRCRAKDVFTKLAALNRLSPLATKVPPPFLAVGQARRRGMNIAVVWLRAPKLGFEQLCRGLRADLGVDGLVVLVAKKPPTSFAAADKIVAFELELDANGYMPLVRAIEELTSDYRVRASSTTRCSTSTSSTSASRQSRAIATSWRSTARTSAAFARVT